MYRDHLLNKLEETAFGMLKLRQRVFAESGLPSSQARVLSALFEHGQISQADIGRLLDIAGPTTKKLVESLVERGFVRLEDSGSDKRLKIVCLTKTGNAQKKLIDECTKKIGSEVVEGLSEPEVIMTGLLLARISENLRDGDDGETGPLGYASDD